MSEITINTIEDACRALVQGNKCYVNAQKKGNISQIIKSQIPEEGQKPYAVVVTCSDSRVPAEYIFSAGIGELFVIRTAGHVIGDFELGSIEYGVKYLGAKVVCVLGHNHCGAVKAAMGNHGKGYVQKILNEIIPVITGEKDVEKCEKLNIENSVSRIMESDMIKNLTAEGYVKIISGKYDIETGIVEFY
ncbi:carbonic anhydrase [Acetobacterium bakii]|uniref:carbonic anhydrase n=1 Tax=Acetobacterium bakii TaxID=52689 RepID=A0A0L6U1W4_9FIRM|nr:carbonic anhydrase [Acetobacterium bakii]KNZ41790.1 carbonic anhydrase [Acetobacterium bakii]